MQNDMMLGASQLQEQFPEYLRSYDLLQQHFRGHLEGLNSTEKGARFARFVQRLIPQTVVGADFEVPTLSEKKANDEGVDLTAIGKDGRSTLYVQAKLWVDRAEAIDSIISKFQAFHTTYHSEMQKGTLALFDEENKPVHFLLVTLSPLDNIVTKYEKKEFSSRTFYEKLKAENRISFVGGPTILPILQDTYRKTSQLPTNLVLDLETDAVQKDNVYVGIISNNVLTNLYQQFGDALFFENIRDFIGLPKERPGRTTPNADIVKTIQESPDKMLEKNNGIVIRAENVERGETGKQLILSKGSIVNGCQTTMCLVSNPSQNCFVPVKIVQTNDSWDIARAANYQNAVDGIDLELAKHLRPQLAKRAATISGARIDGSEESAFQIIDSIYDKKVAYDETRLLYIGLFSRLPNNVFSANYTELSDDLIERFHLDDPYNHEIIDVLFSLQGASQEGLKIASEKFTHPSYSEMFKRFYRDDSPSYRCFVSILALCGAVNINIAERKADVNAEYERIKQFFEKARSVLDGDREIFLIYYVHAVKLWMQAVKSVEADETVILRDMRTKSERLKFTNMYQNLCMEADADDRLNR